MDKTLENLKETLEDEIKKIVKNGDITSQELDNVKDAVCVIDMIDNMSMGENGEGGSYGYSNRNMAYRYPSYAYGDYSERYRDSYGDRMHDGNYGYRNHDRGSYRYDGDSYHDGSYHDSSYRRGRSPVTGRYISRGHEDGYSGHSIMDRMVASLESMYDEAKTDHERQTVSEWINRLRNSN